ncbi:hypothetical protein ACFOPQ_12470 [Deinococcus antarcticus]|uniref:Uncharacterized protein n=1 Tax=Deinococcus antarcticus TaxID=1298767 RepID=A0ABV8A778_9DEIO
MSAYGRPNPAPTKLAKPVWPQLLLALVLLALADWGYRVATQPRNLAVQPQALQGTPAQDWQTLKGRS